ncbi:MAG: 7-cyano-7-deazaguanine synthase, partial [Mesorhizobium sp.]
MKSAVLLASGGLDSTTVAYRLAADGVDVFPFFLDYGQHCVEMEWDRVNEVLPRGMRRPERCDISDIFNGSSSRLIKEADLWEDNVADNELYVPYRTMLFFAAAAARAQTLG